MGFSYKPFDITLVLIALTAALAVFFRMRRGHLMSWPLFFWMFVFWFQLLFDGPFDILYLCIATGATLLVRFEFHAGFMTKVFMALEFLAYGWVMYTSFAQAFHW
jgi:hypothetical protein